MLRERVQCRHVKNSLERHITRDGFKLLEQQHRHATTRLGHIEPTGTRHGQGRKVELEKHEEMPEAVTEEARDLRS
jgi:hypothetical protein